MASPCARTIPESCRDLVVDEQSEGGPVAERAHSVRNPDHAVAVVGGRLPAVGKSSKLDAKGIEVNASVPQSSWLGPSPAVREHKPMAPTMRWSTKARRLRLLLL